MPKVYTRGGDAGETSLFGGPRVPKDHPRIVAYGDVDELNSTLGVVVAALDTTPERLPPEATADLRAQLAEVQSTLFDLGAELATPALEAREAQGQVTARVTADSPTRVEQWIDALDEELEPLTTFVLPGGHPAAAALHVSRTICRRAERRMVTLAEAEPVTTVALQYINRLSDYLFTAARAVNHRAGVAEPVWRSRDS